MGRQCVNLDSRRNGRSFSGLPGSALIYVPKHNHYDQYIAHLSFVFTPRIHSAIYRSHALRTFATLTWERNDAVSTNCPTVLANLSQFRPNPSNRKENQSVHTTTNNERKISQGADAHPARKALKGKLVTSTQYANWATPDRTRKTRNFGGRRR